MAYSGVDASAHISLLDVLLGPVYPCESAEGRWDPDHLDADQAR